MSRSGNYCQHGDDHYSYEACIRTSLPDGRSVGNITVYSRTTSRHQGMAGVICCDITVDLQYHPEIRHPRIVTPAQLREAALKTVANDLDTIVEQATQGVPE